MERGGDRRGGGPRLPRRVLVPAALVALVAASAALLSTGASRVREWAVMTDELLYAKLATAIADSGSPVPTLHGEHVGFLGIVYPILLAPFYGLLDAPTAFQATHFVNSVLIASAAVPAYLLARRLLPQAWSLAVALLSVALPWALLAGFVMSEAAAYPVFLWAFLACLRAVSDPSPRRDALALVALAVAFFTRPQFLFLAAVLPLAVVLAEVGAAGRSGLRTALRGHPLLASVYAAGLAAAVPLAATGSADRLLGDYAVTATEGSLLPAGVWKAAALHLDVLAVGLGVLPFLLGAGWALSRLRSASPQARAFGALTVLSLAALALETASYDLRFGGSGVVRDRYLFYVAPPLLAAATAFLLERRPPSVGLTGATAFFAATVALADFEPRPGVWVDSPASVLNGLIHDESAGLPAGVFVALGGIALGAVAAGAIAATAVRALPPRAAAAGFVVAVFAFSGSVTGYAFDRLLSSRNPSGLPLTGESRVRNWVDLATRGPVALLAYPVSREWGPSAVLWWDVELWNRTVRRALVGPDGTFTYTPFPARTLDLDFGSGRFPGTESAPPYVVAAQGDARFGLAASQAGASYGLSILAVERPYRARWATQGLDVDGWAIPGRRADLRVYAEPGRGTELVRVGVALDVPVEAQARTRFRLTGPRVDVRGSVQPRQQAVTQVEVCVPASGHTDLALTSGPAVHINGPPLQPEPTGIRLVGVHVVRVAVEPTGAPCAV